MQLEFRNVITLIFILGFFGTIGTIMYLESDGLTSTIAESQIANIAIGALITSIGTIVAFLYKAKTGDGNDG